MSPCKSLAAPLVLGLLVSTASLAVGFCLGSQGYVVKPPSAPTNDAVITDKQEVVEEEESEDEDEYENAADGDLSAIQSSFMEHCKLVLVVRTDLNMTPGKIAAQCGHATLACYKALVAKNPKLVHHWERTGQAKIALKATSEEQLLELEATAKSLNLCARSIQDMGRTQVEAGSRTVLGIGPAPVELINQVTGKLRLL